MSISADDIAYIAHLARLQLSEAEKQEAALNFKNILALIDQMQSADTDQLEPLSHAIEASQPLREDIVTEKNQRDDLQKIAPKCEQGLYLVPKVID
ncbi:MAG: Asp-tRNA(Asn)/Glu-tRNA(Gln) amidotransferase GatCAB subunit C [SAR86 cluster bacterium]|uniref:Aspartyl/glutamyl-tRNA(Asn/Gln) amidotransferase subunit C n=1 Tax=SAR86 cluster bacterium TaxID=2030880 RepID=A0A2A5CFE7_9GAMM|nr:Asp-tRNA(Asn)/Glu-tRNA(Gln) amidotransferase subunit GatC [Gammaproteobacteria bacterium AH-315-E17]PCJ42614.1 MAG: Asp-tRNA(Asn)/Glu-tRNA(Gln) amidotransferase GatCAB subunit C [SAR86 cluster bacterium]